MDPLSSTASVIAVISLAGSVVKICGGYIQEVKGAKDEIIELQQAITDLANVLQELELRLRSSNGLELPSSQNLEGPLSKCHSTLAGLEMTISPRKRTQVMRRLGIRALVWPFNRLEVKRTISDLERYKSTFILSLQIDTLSLQIDQK